MPTWYLPSAAAAVLLLTAVGLWLRHAKLSRRAPGRHRPGTVVPVGELYLISYPALFERHHRFALRYGRGADQAAYWVYRVARLAELRTRAQARRVERDRTAGWGWLLEPTTERRMVTG